MIKTWKVPFLEVWIMLPSILLLWSQQRWTDYLLAVLQARMCVHAHKIGRNWGFIFFRTNLQLWYHQVFALVPVKRRWVQFLACTDQGFPPAAAFLCLLRVAVARRQRLWLFPSTGIEAESEAEQQFPVTVWSSRVIPPGTARDVRKAKVMGQSRRGGVGRGGPSRPLLPAGGVALGRQGRWRGRFSVEAHEGRFPGCCDFHQRIVP